MAKQLTKTTYAGLDVGKLVSAFLILLYHYYSEHGPLLGILDEVLSLYAIAVAVFMTISGFLTFYKLVSIQETQIRWLIVKQQVKRILTIYILWSVPYLVFTIVNWDWNGISATFIVWQIQGWIFKSTFYTIWFMPMLAIGLVLTFWLTEKLPEKVVVLLTLLMYMIGSLTLTYNFIGVQIPGFNEFNEFATTWLGGSRGWLFYAFPLIMVGRFLVKVHKRMEPIQMAFLSCVCVGLMLVEALLLRHISDSHTGIDMTIMMVPTVYFILGFLLSVKLPNGKYYMWMRKMSTLIFMSQRLLLTVLPHIFVGFFSTYVFVDNNIGAVIICGGVTLFSATIIYGANKLKFLQALY